MRNLPLHTGIILLAMMTGSRKAGAAEPVMAEGMERVVINEVLSSNTRTNYDRDFGAFSDWIELYNPTEGEMDLEGWFLSDDPGNPDKWNIPGNTVIPPGGYLLFWADGMNLVPGQKTIVEFTEIREITVQEYHLNFRISREKEEVLLFDPDLELMDAVYLEEQERDYSFGRDPQDPGTWRYLGEPTPLGENSSRAADSFILSGKPQFSLPGGLYDAALWVEFMSVPPGAEIRYTTNGSDPTGQSEVYSGPIPVHFSQVIKARLYEEGMLPGEVVTETFVINEDTPLPVLSITTDHRNLWGFDFGLYQNNLKNREIMAHLEYFDESGQKAFDINAGLQLFGSQIFQFDQKPFSIFFRNRYGQDSLNYRLFRNKDIASFNSLVLRNGGNDNGLTMFRDGLGAALIENRMDLDYQSYLPVVVYMNGDYWGIFNLREKLNEEYLQANHGTNPDHVDILEDSLRVNNGDANHYSEMLSFVSMNDLGNEDNYAYVSRKIDVDELINYMSYKIYGGYKQWQVNSKYWRERDPGSGWRWIAFDLEHCFAGPGGENYDGNTFVQVLEPGPGPAEWPTLLFRKLMENEHFRAEFIQRTALFLGTVFRAERVEHMVDSLKSRIEPEMEDHIGRWGSPYSMTAWQQHVELVRDFARNRNGYMFRHMMDYFQIEDTSSVTVACGEGGKVAICHSLVLEDDSVSLTLFNGLPVSLAALPGPGYRFAGWNGAGSGPDLQLIPEGDTFLMALFEPTDQHLLPDTVRGTLILEDRIPPYYTGGTVIIPAGDSLIIREGVTILMDPGASIVNFGFLEMGGTAADPVTIDINPNLTGAYLKSRQDQWGGLIIHSPDTTRILHTVLLNASSGLGEGEYKGAVSAVNSILRIKGVTITGVPDPVYGYKSNVEIESCTLSSNGTGDLINLRACEHAVVRDNDLKGNFYEDTDAIDLDNVTHAVVEGNLIYSFFGSNSDGIDLGEGSTGILIRNNRIFSCSDKAISVGQASSAEVTGNLIVDCNMGFGIKDFGSFAHINQNTLYNNQTGIACYEKNPGRGGGSAQVENTIISNSTARSVFVDELSTLTISYSLSDTELLLGYNNLFGDPRFRGASSHVFLLDAGSPCINSGTPSQQDPDGTRADIGAFLTGNGPVTHPILVSEINFNAHGSFDTGDWIELYNFGNHPVDLSNWVMKGENPGDEFFFPDNLFLQQGDYLVIAGQRDSVKQLHGNSINLTGDLAFGLNREGEVLKIYNADYQLVHSLQYGSADPWPDGPDGKGATLELYTGSADDSRPDNWHASYLLGGTPGRQNSETDPVTGLFINEFMAKNDLAFADENGEYDDWIEIYNSNAFPVDLGGLHFQSGNGEMVLSMIPLWDAQRTTIEPLGYKLFWADKDPEQGILHTDFNIGASGGTVALSQVIDRQTHIIDRIDFTTQKSDVAFGRYPDGEASLAYLYLTPGASNRLITATDHRDAESRFLIYPNPADDQLFLEIRQLDHHTPGAILSLNGSNMLQFMLSPGQQNVIDVSMLQPGVYILMVRGPVQITEKIVIF